MITLNRYPRKGEKIRAEVMGRYGVKVAIGRFTGKVSRAKSGEVLGTIDTGTGQVSVPWTLNRDKVVFYGEEDWNYKLAHAAGQDAGNRHMRQASREKWVEEDYNAAVAELNRILPDNYCQ